MIKSLEKLVKIGIELKIENGKKKVTLPKNWTNITKSIYNNESNYAILTGKLNDIIVVDLDNKEPDFIGLNWFETEFGELSNLNTLVTKTVNNGYHIYFKYNPKIKNKNNFKNLHVDILSDNKCVYEGTNYTVLFDNPIRKLTDNEFESLCLTEPDRLGSARCDNKSLIKNNVTKNIVTKKIEYTKVNQLLKLPNDTLWIKEKLSNSTKFIPQCFICVVDPTQEHSHSEHSALFINSDNSIVSSCFSHGTQVISPELTTQILNMLILNKNNDINNKDTQQVAKRILECKTIIYKDKQWYILNDSSGIYEHKDDLQIINEFETIVNLLLDENLTYGWFDWLNKIHYKKSLLEELKAKCFIDTELNTNPFLLGFPNGVLNLETSEFRLGDSNEYISMKCGIDYNPSCDTSLAETILEGIFPNDDERSFMMTKLALCLEGFNREQALMFNYGFSASNGKSFLMERFRFILGDYGGSFPVTLLTNKMKGAGEANSSLIEFLNKRFLYCSEPESGSKLNTNMIKQLTGDIIKTRGLYTTKEQEIQPTFKLFVCCNNLPNFDSYDEGIARRIFISEFSTKFCDNPKKKHERQLIRYKPAELDLINKGLMTLIINHYFELQNNIFKYSEPESFNSIRKLFLNDNKDTIKNVLLDTFEIGEQTDYVKLKDIKDALKTGGVKEKDIISIIKIVLDTFDEAEFKKHSHINNKQVKNFFINLKLK